MRKRLGYCPFDIESKVTLTDGECRMKARCKDAFRCHHVKKINEKDIVSKFMADIRFVKDEKGMSQVDLAKATGSSEPGISLTLHGLNSKRGNMELRTMVKLAKAVGKKVVITLEDL